MRYKYATLKLNCTYKRKAILLLFNYSFKNFTEYWQRGSISYVTIPYVAELLSVNHTCYTKTGGEKYKKSITFERYVFSAACIYLDLTIVPVAKD